MQCDQHFPGQRCQPVAGDRFDRRLSKRVLAAASPKERVGDELGMPLPTKLQSSEIGSEVIGARGGRHGAVPLAEQHEMIVDFRRGLLAGDYRQM